MNYNLHAFVTKDLVEQKKKVGFMYKEKSDNINDSGWRFFSGDESQNYVDNADNIIICSLNDVINSLDSSVEQYLNSEIGTAYERNKDSGLFLQVNDFKFENELD